MTTTTTPTTTTATTPTAPAATKSRPACASPIPRRQSHRVRKPISRPSTPVNHSHGHSHSHHSHSHNHTLPTPRPSQSPTPSRCSTPVATATNRRTSMPKRVEYVTVGKPLLAHQQETTTTTTTTATPEASPTVNWDCVTYVISDQNIRSVYEKPVIPPGSTTVTSYGRVITTTTTTTVTTTIATTEILHPGEEGYLESLARQQQQGPQAEARFNESRNWSMGTDRQGHDSFHQVHHRTAEPARPVVPTAA